MIAKFLGWDECSFEEYALLCDSFGFNCESSPLFIKFMLNKGADFRFLSYKRNNNLVGGVCLDNGWLTNDLKNPKRTNMHLPIPAYSILPPFMDGVRVLAPFKSKCIYPSFNSFINTSFHFLSKRRVAYTKDVVNGFSKKSISTMNRKERLFLEDGGSFVDVNALSPLELFNIYDILFFNRRGVRINEPELNIDFFRECKNNFFGDVVYLNGEPVGIQLLIFSLSKKGFFVDFINIGYDMNINKHSLGSILMWNNLKKAHAYAVNLNVPMYFSFGAMSGAYKARWCLPQTVGRILTI
ncbi:transcriptional regulator [Budviciaceae bacterium BWR-B9]|uniref:Transcriptional regulator n=1 Tax=Limnobaculum allomyrinae TaxID=2791986 RepID=A0ABS1IQG9_9GAMM|nr:MULTISPECIES: antimicrobial resistance protein Mig-14 [Limnobaculum]MBK5143964.1 transcriptional regulator [Limnobaculum allomyrinae]MBV7691623.1 antimicrobial resistance protein Mig-14 [Limnobaculum sp. M2-1]